MAISRNLIIRSSCLAVLFLLILQLAIANPQTISINRTDEPIDENVEFSVNPFLGQVDADGKIRVTFNCEAIVPEGVSPNVDWFLISEGNREIASLESADPREPCGDEWRLEPGTYEIATRKTDNIRFDQSVQIHSIEIVAWELRIACMIAAIAFTSVAFTIRQRIMK